MYLLVTRMAQQQHVRLPCPQFRESCQWEDVMDLHRLYVESFSTFGTQPLLLLVPLSFDVSHVVCQLLRTLMVAWSRAFLHSAIREGDVKASIQQSERTLPPSFLLLLLIRCDDHRPARLVNHYVTHSSFLSFISHRHLSHPFHIHVVNVLRFTWWPRLIKGFCLILCGHVCRCTPPLHIYFI